MASLALSQPTPRYAEPLSPRPRGPAGSAGSSQPQPAALRRDPEEQPRSAGVCIRPAPTAPPAPGLSPSSARFPARVRPSRPGARRSPGALWGARKSPEELCPRLTPSLVPAWLGPGPPRASPLLSTNPLSTGSAGTRWNLTRPHKWRRTCQGASETRLA